MRKLNGPLSLLYGGFLGFGLTMVVLLIPTSLVSGCEKAGNACAAAQQKQVKGEVVEMTVFAYCLCQKCCGDSNPDGKTATGKDGRKYLDGVAVDPKLIPYGTRLWIPGIGEKIADDTGARLKEAGAKQQYLICFRVKNHSEAEKYKRQNLKIVFLED